MAWTGQVPAPGKAENSVEAGDVEFALLNVRLVNELGWTWAGARVPRSSLGGASRDHAERRRHFVTAPVPLEVSNKSRPLHWALADRLPMLRAGGQSG